MAEQAKASIRPKEYHNIYNYIYNLTSACHPEDRMPETQKLIFVSCCIAFRGYKMDISIHCLLLRDGKYRCFLPPKENANLRKLRSTNAAPRMPKKVPNNKPSSIIHPFTNLSLCTYYMHWLVHVAPNVASQNSEIRESEGKAPWGQKPEDLQTIRAQNIFVDRVPILLINAD